jgi:hypothetical protein
MLNFAENLLENERDPRSGPMNDQDHSLSLSDPDRSLALSHFLTNPPQNSASCHTALRGSSNKKTLYSTPSCVNWAFYGTRGPLKRSFHSHFKLVHSCQKTPTYTRTRQINYYYNSP